MIGAVVVLYNPDEDQLKHSLNALSVQVDQICLIDNSDGNNHLLYSGFTNVHYIPLMGNRGIAAAQNIGINYFKECGYHFVLFSDQDSIASAGIVAELYGAYELLKDSMKIAAVGPLPMNRQDGKPYLYEANIIRKYEKGETSYPSDIYEMHSIISSFSLVPIQNFQWVGLMEEELFIDFVDQEWCWRAAYECNMKSLLLSNITISHQLGQGDQSFLSMRLKISTPFRLYYQFRNFLILRKRAYTPGYWKKMNGRKFIFKSIYYPLFISPRFAYLKSIVQGIQMGIKYKGK